MTRHKQPLGKSKLVTNTEVGIQITILVTKSNIHYKDPKTPTGDELLRCSFRRHIFEFHFKFYFLVLHILSSLSHQTYKE